MIALSFILMLLVLNTTITQFLLTGIAMIMPSIVKREFNFLHTITIGFCMFGFICGLSFEYFMVISFKLIELVKGYSRKTQNNKNIFREEEKLPIPISIISKLSNQQQIQERGVISDAFLNIQRNWQATSYRQVG